MCVAFFLFKKLMLVLTAKLAAINYFLTMEAKV